MLFVQDSNAGVYDVSQAVLDTGLRTFGLEENTDMNGRHQNGVGKFQVRKRGGFLRSVLEKV